MKSARLFPAACASALLLASCASVPVARLTPDAAPLATGSLKDAERAAYDAVSSSAGAEGAQALYLLGLDKAAGGDWPSAAGLWRTDLMAHPGTGWDRLSQYKLAQALEKAGDGGAAFAQYEGLLTGTAVANLPELARQSCQRLIPTLPQPTLDALASGAVDPEFLSAIRVRLLQLDLAAGRLDAARAGVDAYLRFYPLGPGLDAVEQVSRALEAAVVVDRRALGVLVPLGGDLAAFGTQVLQGAKLAVDAFNVGRPDADKIRLIVADEGDDTATAAAAAVGLIDKDHVIGLLGPLGSETARALLPLLASRRTPMLSPSATRADLAGVSPWFFRDTLSPEQQASAMADYAVIARRLTRVASLAPDNVYGVVSARAFAERLRALGGAVPVAVTYDASGTRDFKDAMLALGGIDPGLGKTADQDEMRDQQFKVEQACNAFGLVLKDRLQALAPAAASAPVEVPMQAEPVPDATGPTAVSRLRLMVVDFAQDTACAQLNAGRAFADRFARTLAQLDGVDVIGPQAALRWWNPLTTSAQALSLSLVAQAAAQAGADFVLVGNSASLPPDPVKWPNRGLFSLSARMVDTRTTTVCAQRGFTWTQYEAPPANPLGLQAVYLPASAEDVTLAVPNLRFYDLSLPLLGSDQWDRPELRDHLNDLDGAVFTAGYWGRSPDASVSAFDAAYRRTYAAKPDVLAAQAYDAAGLMARALLDGVSDRASLRAWLSRVRGYDGASGHFGFKGLQDADRRPAVVAVKDGQLILLKEP